MALLWSPYAPIRVELVTSVASPAGGKRAAISNPFPTPSS